jgi:hypothetical protein
MTYGSEETMKTLCAVGIELAPKNDQTVTFKWLRDGQSEQSTTVTQGGSAVLGVWSTNQFTLDTSTLGGTRYQPRYIETEEGGEFRAVRYTVYDATTSSDVEVHGLATKIAIGTDSTENE